jgi:hypothetical protein
MKFDIMKSEGGCLATLNCPWSKCQARIPIRTEKNRRVCPDCCPSCGRRIVFSEKGRLKRG